MAPPFTPVLRLRAGVRSVACLALGAMLSPPTISRAAESPSQEPTAEEQFSVHYQATVATQVHPPFRAAYSGSNSMRPSEESATSVVSGLFFGARLWAGAEVYLQPELSGGRGLSSTLGVAAFPSGEVYRVGDPTPAIKLARLFLRQVVGLGGGEVPVEPGATQLRGTRDRDALTLTIGKVAIPDFVDKIPYASDPHIQFESWGLFASAAYDYPADTRGYTWGVAGELSVEWWSVRAGLFLEPKVANQMDLEWRLYRARGVVAEFEARYTLGGRPGAARLLVFLNSAHMGSYRQAFQGPAANLDVTATRAFGRTKAGFAASVNQDLGRGLGAFARISWNDGRNETWAFTEVDQSVGAGAVQSGSRWGRPEDEAGIALVVSGISSLHRQYLAAGGYGFIVGDGSLRYGVEVLGEAYYRFALSHEVAVGLHYQPIANPAYNRDRGPVQVFTGLVHVAL